MSGSGAEAGGVTLSLTVTKITLTGQLLIFHPLLLLARRKEQRRLGSGSLEQDGPRSIVAMKKEEQTGGRSITPDLENDNVMRTKRASGFRNDWIGTRRALTPCGAHVSACRVRRRCYHRPLP